MDLLHHLFGLGKIGSIRGVTFYLHAQCGYLFFCFLSVFIYHEIGECDVGTFTGKTQSNLFTDAACGAGHNSCFSFK